MDKQFKVLKIDHIHYLPYSHINEKENDHNKNM